MFSSVASSPDHAALDALCTTLAARATATAEEGPWRSGAFAMLADSGLLAGFIPEACGGTAASEVALLEALVAVAERCLTTALALTQWASGCRIIASGPEAVRQSRLPALARGTATTTVGIAQLSTSRRHLGRPALAAVRKGNGWRLDGLCPWVTGADSSDTIVTGAVDDAGEQRFFVVPTAAAGLGIAPPMRMLALSGSRTSSVTFAGVEPADVIVPEPGGGVRTGGLSTTALALGPTPTASWCGRPRRCSRPRRVPASSRATPRKGSSGKPTSSWYGAAHRRLRGSRSVNCRAPKCERGVRFV